jgi:hypothetical protein
MIADFELRIADFDQIRDFARVNPRKLILLHRPQKVMRPASPIADCGLRIADCGFQTPEQRKEIRDPKSAIRNPKWP